MKRKIKIVGLVLIGVLILMQFIRPDRNLGQSDSENDLLILTMAPDSLARILKSSCYDCHSNRTNYPWYSNVAPVSWILDKHIKTGKEELNMSTFGLLEKSRQIGMLSDICEIVESGNMPLKSYVLIHKETRISDENLEAICNWTELAALKIMRQ